MSNDPRVAPLLMDAMANVAPTGSDGFDQLFGLNALSGDHGSKQGWTDVGSSDQVQLHSVGWTDRYFVAILETTTTAGENVLRADSTAAAQAVLAAEGAGTATGTTAAVAPPGPAPEVAPATTPSPAQAPTGSDPEPPATSALPAVFERLGRQIASLVRDLEVMIGQW